MRSIVITIQGIVQGVGFRPFVYQKAHNCGVNGFVRNNAAGVEILAQAAEQRLEEFIAALKTSPPPQSRIEKMDVTDINNEALYPGFTIEDSRGDGGRTVRISPDLSACGQCLKELFDPRDRRYLYPYINCTNCGPRFTIIRDIPYDRDKTTMAEYRMCPSCQREYENPENRRFHAQPNACHVCGPRIHLLSADGRVLHTGRDASTVQALLEELEGIFGAGGIVALKGLGGYHIACRADDSEVVARLRTRKRREEKPLALMVRDIPAAERIVDVNEREATRLQAVDAPIILLDKKTGHGLAAAVAPDSGTFGVMLPYTPLQHLTAHSVDFPLVMTSANFSDEPIAYKDEEALKRLGALCDYFVTGERDIHVRTDDSVIRLFRGADFPIRRARGFVPNPVLLSRAVARPVLALGAELKNTVCLAAGQTAWLSRHVGDLAGRETYRAFTQTIAHLLRLQRVTPAVVAHDLHPRYHSSQYAMDPPPDCEWMFEAVKFPVQHHHAHIASAMAEHGLEEKVVGVALDGTGLGMDGSIWGGEILVADFSGFERKACLAPIRQPGSDLAVREPWRMALAYLFEVFGEEWTERLPPALAGIPDKKLLITVQQLRQGTSLPFTTSCGRLFDALSAMSGVCLETKYEGQPAIMLEHRCGGNLPPKKYEFDLIEGDGAIIMDWRNVVRQAVYDLGNKKPVTEIAGMFHAGLADAVAEAARRVARAYRLTRVVLSGGCFMNRLLLERTVAGLEKAGLIPVLHTRVPCNDGGISLGQAVVAAARLDG